MLKTIQALTSFNSGELSPLLDGRPDLSKYASGVRHTENFKFNVQGAAVRRTGTAYVSEVKNSNDRTWLVPFVVSLQNSYQLEFGPNYMRVYTNRARVQTSGVAAYNNAISYFVGDLVLYLGVVHYCELNTTPGILPTNTTYWYPQVGSIYEIPTPYTADMLTQSDGTFGLSYEQTNDIMFIACGSKTMPLFKLLRYSPTKWVLTPADFKKGPFKSQNITTTSVTPSAVTGNITLTSSSPIFQAGHVGSLFYVGESKINPINKWKTNDGTSVGDIVQSDGKNYQAVTSGPSGYLAPTHFEGQEKDGLPGVTWLFLDARYGVVKITGYTSPTSVTGTVVLRLPPNVTSGTDRWAHGAWSAVEGWPTKVCLYNERLVAARGLDVWLSVSGDYAGDQINFSARTDGGPVTQDMSISLTLPSNRSTEINWMLSSSSVILGTTDAEFSVEPLTGNLAFGPENVRARQISTYGSKSVWPITIGSIILFVSRCGISLRDYIYQPGEAVSSNDQNLFSDKICQVGISQMSYQKEPDSIIWCAMKDGRLVGLTYSREQYESPPYGGWHAHYIGGDGFVETVSTISSPNQESDETWMIVKRTINGVTKRYIEYITPARKYEEDIIDAFYVDSGLTYQTQQAFSINVPADGLTQYATNVQFVAGGNTFSPSDVGREIHYRYSSLSAKDRSTILYYTGKAEITSYVSPTQVLCTINYPFQKVGTINASDWHLTVTQVSGITHLEGVGVSVLADGLVMPPLTVRGGALNIPIKASKVTFGFGYVSRLQTMRVHVTMSDGSSLGQTAKITSVVVRLNDTIGLLCGPTFDSMVEQVDFRSAIDNMDMHTRPVRGDVLIHWAGDFNADPWLCFSCVDPLPTTIMAIAPTVGISARP